MLFSSCFSSQTTRCKIQLDSDVKAIDDKIKWQGSVSARHVILHFLRLIGHNFWLVYYRFKCKGNLCKYGLCYTWVQMLLQIGPLLRLGSKCYYRWDFYYAWVQMLLRMGPLLHLGPVITLVPFTRNLKKRQFFRTFLFSCALYVSSRTAGALRDEASRARTRQPKSLSRPQSPSFLGHVVGYKNAE